MSSNHRRLEDYYSYKEDPIQHPLYSRLLLALLGGLILGSIAYALYQVIEAMRCQQLMRMARCETADLAGQDDVEAEARNIALRTDQFSWTSTKVEMAPPRPHNHNDYVDLKEPRKRGVVA